MFFLCDLPPGGGVTAEAPIMAEPVGAQVPKPKKKVVIKRVLKVKSQAAPKQDEKAGCTKSEEVEKKREEAEVKVVKSSGAKDMEKEQKEVGAGGQEKPNEAKVKTVKSSGAKDKKNEQKEVGVGDEEKPKETKVKAVKSSGAKDNENEQKEVGVSDEKEPKEEAEVVKSQGATEQSVKEGGTKKEVKKIVIDPPAVERHTTKENIQVFFNPETYQNKKDDTEAPPISTVLDPTQDDVSDGQNGMASSALDPVPKVVESHDGTIEPTVEMGKAETPNESGEDSKKTAKDLNIPSEESGKGNDVEEPKAEPAETVQPGADLPTPTPKDSDLWGWDDWSTWNSWSWSRQWWGWYDEDYDNTWSVKKHQTTPPSSSTTPSSHNLEASLGRLNTVDLEQDGKGHDTTPKETAEKKDLAKENQEDPEKLEKKEKAKKAAHARYMRYYRSVHEGQAYI